MSKLMFAYGANTNREHMLYRCPDAQYVGNARLLDWRLVFRSVADITPCHGASVTGAVWLITPADERELDRFESYPSLYRKATFRLALNGGVRNMMAYVMSGKRTDVFRPPHSYERAIREGYAQCGIDAAQVDAAVRGAAGKGDANRSYVNAWTRLDAQERAAARPKPKQAQLELLERRMFAHWEPKNVREKETA